MRWTAVIGLLASLALPPGPALAQSCGLGSGGIALAGGGVHYDLGAGLSGASAGADLTLRTGLVTVRAGYRHMLLEGDAVDPDAVRLTGAIPVMGLGGVTLCGTGYAAGSRFAVDDDSGIALVGGLGVTLAVPVGDGVTPFLTVRGLGAQTTGTTMGIDVDATGLSLGVEGGVTANLGPFGLALMAAVDGFDGGLGATPFPAQSLELAIGYRF